MEGQPIFFFLVDKNDLDMAFFAGKPVREFLGHGEQTFL